jgi:hypothetical protein
MVVKPLQNRWFVLDAQPAVSDDFGRARSHIVRPLPSGRTGNELQTIVASGFAVAARA